MANPCYLFLLIFIFLFNLDKISSSTCTLNFTQFPYEAKSECFDLNNKNSITPLTTHSCCVSAMQYIFQAMSVKTNQSQSIFLESNEAQVCTTTFQNLHRRTDLSKCQIQDFISSSTPNQCSRNVDSIRNVLGVDRYNSLHSECKDLSMKNYSDDACFNCVVSYRESSQILRESEAKRCDEALLVSLASSDVNSPNWVPGTFSCLWDEIQFPAPVRKTNKDGFLLGSKKLLVIIIVAAALVVIAPILYKLTRKQLQQTSQKDIENLSVIVLKKTLEDESRSPFLSSDLYIFSPDEISKATHFFDSSNFLGEGSLGRVYLGVLPSGMRVAIKRLNEGHNKIHNITDDMIRKAKIRHPNLVSILGCCDRGDICLVYEYCTNGDLSSWIFGDRKTPILTWERRMQLSVDIARGLWFLHTNPFEKMVHGDIKLTNILLNERLEAKIADSITASYKSKKASWMQTIENDIFQFGVVLLQILTGRKPKFLVEEASEALKKGGRISGMADPRLNGAYISTEFRDMLSVAVLCANSNENERPSMEQVVRKLEEAQILV